MSGADLKDTLRQGGRIFGTMLSINRNPRWIPILDGVGLDYVIIDTEHSPRSRGELGDYLTMFSAISVVPIVRIPIPDSHYVTMAIDAGAQGILAPYCETVDQVREVVKAAKFRPLKGAAAEQALATGEFPSGASEDYLAARNRDNICIIGIESRAAVANLDAILDVPHIDAIFVGPNDMSISLGVPDDYAQEIYKTTVKSIIDNCESRGLATLVHHQTPELSEYWIEQGARFVLHGTDRRALAEGFRTEFTRLRDKATSVPRNADPRPKRCLCGCGNQRNPGRRFSSGGHDTKLRAALSKILSQEDTKDEDYRMITNPDLANWAQGRMDDEKVVDVYTIADYREALAMFG